MGKKPVFGMAGLLVAGLAVCGCQRQNHCGPSCGPQTGMPVGAHAVQGPSKGQLGQPAGTMHAGTPATSPGQVGTGSTTNSITGFPTVGNPAAAGGGMMSPTTTGSSFPQRMGTPTGRTPMQDPLRPANMMAPASGTSGTGGMMREVPSPTSAPGSQPLDGGPSQSRYQTTPAAPLPPRDLGPVSPPPGQVAPE